MLRRMVQTGLFAGFLTALVYSLVQAVTVTPLIFDAEFYEAQAGDPSHGSVHVHEGGSEHIHDAEPATAPWEPEDGIERYGFTFLANVVTALGFAFMLVAAIAVRGRTVDAHSGLLWGISGFAAFALMPALGLAPEVPGAATAPLADRQLWYAGAVAATALGLGVIAFTRPLWLKGLAVAIILVPHLAGAPLPDLSNGTGPVPQELAARYVVWSLVTALFFWAILGTLCGYFYSRFAPAEAVRTQTT